MLESMFPARRTVRPPVTIIALLAIRAFTIPAHAQTLTVTVVTDQSRTTVSDARILYMSSRGYASGGDFQSFGALYVTDTIVPPPGITIRPGKVPWNDLREILFLRWYHFGSRDRFTRARITFADSTTREVFVVVPERQESWAPLEPLAVKVVGRTSIGGTEHEVEIRSRDLKGLVFGPQE